MVQMGPSRFGANMSGTTWFPGAILSGCIGCSVWGRLSTCMGSKRRLRRDLRASRLPTFIAVWQICLLLAKGEDYTWSQPRGSYYAWSPRHLDPLMAPPPSPIAPNSLSFGIFGNLDLNVLVRKPRPVPYRTLHELLDASESEWARHWTLKLTMSNSFKTCKRASRLYWKGADCLRNSMLLY